MKYLKSIVLFCSITLSFYSCSKVNQLDSKLGKEMSTYSKMKDGLGILNITDTILPLDSTKFLQKPNIMTPQGIDLDLALQQLEGIDFYIEPVYSGSGEKVLETNGKGYAVTLSSKQSNKQSQLFHFVILPATSGIPYLIYSSKEGTPMGGGSTASAPNDYLPYIKPNNTGSLFGFSWDFRYNDDTTALYIVNQDMIYSTGPWSIGHYVMNASTGGDLTLEEDISSVAQQFNLIPNDIFQMEVDSFKLLIDQGVIISAGNVMIDNGHIENAGSAPSTQHIAVHKNRTTNYSFKETNGFTTTLSGGSSFSIDAKVIKIGNDYTITNSSSYSVEYGEGESRAVSIDYSADIIVPGHQIVDWTLYALEGTMRIPYIAKVRGINTNKELTLRGFYNGGAFSSHTLRIDSTHLEPLAPASSAQPKVINESFKITNN